MKYLQLAMLATTALLSASSCKAGLGTDINVDVDIQVGVNNCTGGHSTCPITQTMGAVGDPFTINPMRSQVTDLGRITEKTTKQLAIPSKINGYTLYSVTPSEGELAGSTIYLALRLGAKGRPGTRLAGLYPIELFRLVTGEDPSRNWARAAEFLVKGSEGKTGTKGTGAISTLSFTFMPNGNATTVDPKGKTLEFILGKKQLQ